MKKHALTLAIIASAATSLSATADQANLPGGTASSQVSHAAVVDSLNQGIDLSRLSTEPGVHIVPLEQSAFRGALANAIRQEIDAQANQGSYAPASGAVPDLRASLRGASPASGRTRMRMDDPTYPTLELARPHLRYEPASVAGTSLATAALQDVATGGQVASGRWSGVTRTWEVAGLGVVQLDESEFRETGGSITVIKEWLNADVSGYPATLKTMRVASGNTLVSVAWATDTTSYRLDLQPLDPSALRVNEKILLELANGIGK